MIFLQKSVRVVRCIFTQTLMQRILKPVINTLFLVLTLFIFYQNQHLLPTLSKSLSIQNVILCIVLYMLSLIIQAAIWIDMIGYRRHDWQRAIDDFIQTYLMGRLPGGWWKWLSRVTVYRAEHLSTKAAFWVNTTELALLILTGITIVFVLCIPALLFQLVIVILYPLIVWKVLASLVTQNSEFNHWRSFWRVGWWCTGYTTAWLLGAFILFILSTPFISKPLSIIDALRLGTISGIVGLILQFIPISTLFRDLTLFALLDQFMEVPQIVLTIFAIRLIYSISDLISAWGISLILFVIRRYTTRNNVQSLIS